LRKDFFRFVCQFSASRPLPRFAKLTDRSATLRSKLQKSYTPDAIALAGKKTKKLSHSKKLACQQLTGVASKIVKSSIENKLLPCQQNHEI